MGVAIALGLEAPYLVVVDANLSAVESSASLSFLFRVLREWAKRIDRFVVPSVELV